MKILVVDDEPLVTKVLGDMMALEGYEVRKGHSGEECLALEREWRPDLVVLDVMMPGAMTGLDALRALRRYSDVPVILATAKGTDIDKVLGLEYADDYLVKPFSHAELAARIRAVLRRAGQHAAASAASRIQVGDLCIDREVHEATFAGRVLPLTATAFKILVALAGQAGRVVARDALMEQVWGSGTHIDPHALDVHIGALRRKLEPDPAQPAHIVTVRAVGFRYVE